MTIYSRFPDGMCATAVKNVGSSPGRFSTCALEFPKTSLRLRPSRRWPVLRKTYAIAIVTEDEAPDYESTLDM
jgi:hypothetical protein